MNPRFCGFCRLWCFFLNWIQGGFFFLSLFLFFSKLTEFIFLSLSRSLVSYCSETWEIGVSKGLSPHSFTLGAPLFFSTSNTYHVELETTFIDRLFGKLEGGLFYSRPSLARHFILSWTSGRVWNGISKSVPLVLTCTESGLIKVGILNNAVTLTYKRLVIVQQRAQGNTQRKSLETNLTLHGRFICVFQY